MTIRNPKPSAGRRRVKRKCCERSRESASAIVGKVGKRGNLDFFMDSSTSTRRSSPWKPSYGKKKGGVGSIIPELSNARTHLCRYFRLKRFCRPWQTFRLEIAIKQARQPPGVIDQESGMNTRFSLQNQPSSRRVLKTILLGWFACSITALAGQSVAGPPRAEDDIDYAASGFALPPGVDPRAWSTAAGASMAGGMNYASQPQISGPMMP